MIACKTTSCPRYCPASPKESHNLCILFRSHLGVCGMPYRVSSAHSQVSHHMTSASPPQPCLPFLSNLFNILLPVLLPSLQCFRKVRQAKLRHMNTCSALQISQSVRPSWFKLYTDPQIAESWASFASHAPRSDGRRPVTSLANLEGAASTVLGNAVSHFLNENLWDLDGPCSAIPLH